MNLQPSKKVECHTNHKVYDETEEEVGYDTVRYDVSKYLRNEIHRRLVVTRGRLVSVQ